MVKFSKKKKNCQELIPNMDTGLQQRKVQCLIAKCQTGRMDISCSKALKAFCCSVTQSCPTPCRPRGLWHSRLPFPSLSPGICSNSCSLSQCCHQTISSSVAAFPSCPQSFPASGSLPMSRLFLSGGRSVSISPSSIIISNDFL